MERRHSCSTPVRSREAGEALQALRGTNGTDSPPLGTPTRTRTAAAGTAPLRPRRRPAPQEPTKRARGGVSGPHAAGRLARHHELPRAARSAAADWLNPDARHWLGRRGGAERGKADSRSSPVPFRLPARGPGDRYGLKVSRCSLGVGRGGRWRLGRAAGRARGPGAGGSERPPGCGAAAAIGALPRVPSAAGGCRWPRPAASPGRELRPPCGAAWKGGGSSGPVRAFLGSRSGGGQVSCRPRLRGEEQLRASPEVWGVGGGGGRLWSRRGSREERPLLGSALPCLLGRAR